MWIMVSGPYTSGAKMGVKATEAERAENLAAMNRTALALFDRGHIPVIGVNMALPVIAAAGEGADRFDAIMMPLSLALAERCDACLRVGGPSKGADEEMERFRAAGKPVYRDLAEVPSP